MNFYKLGQQQAENDWDLLNPNNTNNNNEIGSKLYEIDKTMIGKKMGDPAIRNIKTIIPSNPAIR